MMPEHRTATHEEWQAARAELARRESWVYEPRRRARRDAGSPQPLRRDPDLLLARANRPAPRLQAADGLAVPVRVDLRHGLPVRLRARDDRAADAADPRGEGDDRRSARGASGVVRADRS